MARDRILQIYRGTTAQNDAFTGAQGELTMDTARKEIRIHDGSTAGGNVIGLTPGFIAPFAGSTAPAGWLVCDGSAVSRTTYAKLFAVIGTTYGEGDGNSTFNLPQCEYKILTRSGIALSDTNSQYSGDGVLPLVRRRIGATTDCRGLRTDTAPSTITGTGYTDGYRGRGSGWDATRLANELIVDYSENQVLQMCIKY